LFVNATVISTFLSFIPSFSLVTMVSITSGLVLIGFYLSRKFSLDELTGLYNRRRFFTLTEHQLRFAKQQKIGLLLLYAVLDNLKEINDTFGHEEGDKLLKETANILKSTYRSSDIVARIGGDEFVVFLVGITESHVETVIARLQKQLDIHNAKSNRSHKLSVSVGIAYHDPERPCSIDELLIQADKLMYEQKRRKQKF
jgi:diguanylate cyclase (GGDEF)-like protein